MGFLTIAVFSPRLAIKIISDLVKLIAIALSLLTTDQDHSKNSLALHSAFA